MIANIIEVIVLIAWILWLVQALKKSGVCKSCNPFQALHRRRWAIKMKGNPLFGLTDPRDIVTVLLVSLVKSTGEISREQKEGVLRALRKQFMLSDEEAGHYFAHGSFLMRDTVDILEDAEKIAAPLMGKCTPAQTASVEHMLKNVATEEGRAQPNAYQQALIDKVMHLIEPGPVAI